jgi:hypothetical protein
MSRKAPAAGAGGPHYGVLLEVDPAAAAAAPPPAAPSAFNLVSPLATPALPPVVVAAVRARRVAASRSGRSGATGKRKVGSGNPAAAERAAQRARLAAAVAAAAASGVLPSVPRAAEAAAPYRAVACAAAAAAPAAPRGPIAVAVELDGLYAARVLLQRQLVESRLVSTDVRVSSRAARPPEKFREGGLYDAGADAGAARPPPGLPGAAATRRETAARPEEWHPGFVSAYGVTHVAPARAAAYEPPAPLAPAHPHRWAAMPPRPCDVQTFPADALAGAVAYIRYLAAAAGRLPAHPAAAQAAFNAEQRAQRARLARAVRARDGRVLEVPPPEGSRRSGRSRYRPERSAAAAGALAAGAHAVGAYGGGGAAYAAAAPRAAGGGANPYGRTARDAPDYDPAELTEVRQGPEYQARLPPPRPRRAGPPPPAEARWLAGAVRAPPLPHVAPGYGRVLRGLPAASRAEVVRAASTLMAAAAGAWAPALGLGAMGAAAARALDAGQQAALGEGFDRFGRDFPAIADEYVPGVAPGALAAYYYDVWKLRAVPAAAAAYARREAGAAAADAADAEAAAARAAENARRAERERAANRRRQVREALAWVRAAARDPRAASWNKTAARERVARAAAAFRGAVGV